MFMHRVFTFIRFYFFFPKPYNDHIDFLLQFIGSFLEYDEVYDYWPGQRKM